MEVELAARKQQHVAHIGQVGVGGPRARFSSPRRSPRTMRRAQGYADQDKRQEQRTGEDKDGEMCHAPVFPRRGWGANPGRGVEKALAQRGLSAPKSLRRKWNPRRIINTEPEQQLL